MSVAVVRAWTTPPASNVSAMSAMATVATVTGIGRARVGRCRLRAARTGRQGEADDEGDDPRAAQDVVLASCQSSPSQGPLERRGFGQHRHLRRDLLRLGLHHRFGRAQQRRHVGQARPRSDRG